MASIQVGPVVSDIRGSINGVTFGRNRSGLFARQRVVPVDPSTPIQNTRRAQLTNAAVFWRNTLTQLQRDSWNTLGAVTTFQNALGIDFNPSGISLFIRTNALRLIVGGLFVRDAPVVATIQLGNLTVVHTPTVGIEVTAIVGSEVANGDALFQRSTNVSQGIQFFKSPLLDIFTFPIEAFATLPVLLYSNAVLIPGQAYFLRGRVVQDTGEVTAASFFRVVTSDPL